MGLDVGIGSSNLVKYLEEKWTDFKDLPDDIKGDYAKIHETIYLNSFGISSGGFGIRITNGGPYSHNHYPGHCSISARYLRDKFKKWSFEDLRFWAGGTEIKPYQKGAHTKGYKLTPEIEKIFDDFFLDPHLGGTEIYDYNGSAFKRKPKNNNALCSKDKRGNDAMSKARLPFLIPVNRGVVREVYDFVNGVFLDYREGKIILGSPDRVGRLINLWKDLRHLIWLSNSSRFGVGNIPAIYREGISGRIFGMGFSLQTCANEVKRAALAKSGYKEIDISNCFYSLFYQTAQHKGKKLSRIKAYLEDTRGYRRRIAMDVYGEEISNGIMMLEEAEKIIKTVLLSRLNGAWLTDDKTNSIPKLLIFNDQTDVRSKMQKLKESRDFQEINKDLKRTEFTLIGSLKGRKRIENAMGKRIDTKGVERGAKIAHMLQGVEALILNAILESYPDRVLIPMHDGLVVDRSLDTRGIEEKVFERTGFRIELKEDCDYYFQDSEEIIRRIKKRLSI